jgi:hypothetical protein
VLKTPGALFIVPPFNIDEFIDAVNSEFHPTTILMVRLTTNPQKFTA